MPLLLVAMEHVFPSHTVVLTSMPVPLSIRSIHFSELSSSSGHPSVYV